MSHLIIEQGKDVGKEVTVPSGGMKFGRSPANDLVLDDARPRTTDELYAGQASDPRLILHHRVVEDEQVRQIYEIADGGQP